MSDKIFFDTNIICYAFDLSQPAKKKKCEELVRKVMSGVVVGVVSNQILGEVFNAAVEKLGLTSNDAKIIVKEILQSEKWQKFNYTYDTVNRAVETFEQLKVPFWDLLIAETMKENSISEIITENEKDFTRIPGIKVTNPFKS